MALIPKRTKYRKVHKGRNRGKALKGNTISYGIYGLQATTAGFLTQNQIEAARIAMTRYIKRGGKVWIKVFADKPITKKPAETRMGKGKGAPEYWVAKIKPGKVMFEMSGVNETVARRALELASYKLPVKTKFIMKELTKKEKEEELALELELAHQAQEEIVSENETEEENNEVGGDNNENK